eukprot:6190217-Pleurochrysis_carterae.AAC.1
MNGPRGATSANHHPSPHAVDSTLEAQPDFDPNHLAHKAIYQGNHHSSFSHRRKQIHVQLILVVRAVLAIKYQQSLVS